MVEYKDFVVNYDELMKKTYYNVSEAINVFLNLEVDKSNQTKGLLLHNRTLNPFLKCLETMKLHMRIVVLPAQLNGNDPSDIQAGYIVIKIPEVAMVTEIKVDSY